MPGRHGLSKQKWMYVMLRDGFNCVYCKEEAREIDHVIPASRGGKNAHYNLVAVCRECNDKKYDTLDDQWLAIALGHLAARGEDVKRAVREYGCYNLEVEAELALDEYVMAMIY